MSNITANNTPTSNFSVIRIDLKKFVESTQLCDVLVTISSAEEV